MMCRDLYHCKLVVKNDLNEIDSIWGAIANALEKYGLEKRDLFQINLVVDELFTNIVSYAFKDKKYVYVDMHHYNPSSCEIIGRLIAENIKGLR